MKVFDIKKTELLDLRKKWQIFIFLVLLLGIIVDLLIYFLHDRFKFALSLFFVILISAVAISFFLYGLLVKLRTIKQYLFILSKSENSLLKDKYHFVNKDPDIKVFNSLSFYILNFEKDGQVYSFYFLYNKVPEIKEGNLVVISHVDDIALDYEVYGR